MSRTHKESFRQRMQEFFSRRGTPRNTTGTTQLKRGEFFITPALKKDLSRDSPLNARVKAISQLSTLVSDKKLEDNAIETIWVLIADLLDQQVNADHRHLVLHFLKCVIIGQSEFLGPMRFHFFQVVKDHNIFEDLPQRLDVFRALSDNGKNLLDFEEETGPFLMLWMPDVVSYGKTAEFLQVLVNVIKYNSCYLDDNIIAGLVQHTCSICNRTDKERDIEQALHVLDAVICYSCLPSESLYYFITALCRTVSVKKFCQSSWKLMRNLLGTHLGHSAIYTMCCIMEDSQNINDVVLLRGAVFFVGMARWGSMRVQSLRHNFTSVLPSFHKALTCKHVLVAYEVTLSLQRLVRKYGTDIQAVTWDIILGIIHELFKYIEDYSKCHECLPDQLHDLLTMVETLYDNKVFNGSASQLFAIVEEFAHLRPDRSVLCLVAFRAQAIHPTKEDWIPNLQRLLDRYFRNDNRTVIREAALRVLSSALSSSGTLYEDDLIKLVVLPQLKNICDDRDPIVRNCAVQLLVDSAQVCQSPFCLDILDIIEKVVMKSMYIRTSIGAAGEVEHRSLQPNVGNEERDLVDVMTAVTGLLELFRIKLHCVPSSHALLAFQLLVTHMQEQYKHKYNSEMARDIRAKVFECLLQMRCDSLCRLGISDKDGIYKYSPYILCDSRIESELAGKVSPPTCSSPPPGERHLKPTVIPLIQAFKTVTTCLREETHWKVLSLVLPGLTRALQNKNLVLAANANMDNLCVVLCSLVEDRNHISRLQQSARFNRMDFYIGIYSALTALVPYHSLLEQQKKFSLIKCFEAGLKLKCAQQCVDGLTLCVIEMQETMLKVLPSVILVMSQMSATPTMAIPVLEFLSSLIWFPKLYANFVESEYMSIFAVALHYTNPFKFSLYVVSLAHHVIAMWFIKCRLPFRREFVNCITRGLRANALRSTPDFDSSSSPPPMMKLRRSSSLTEKPNKSDKDRGRNDDGSKAKSDDALDSLNRLLTETCLDMMARYTYSTLATLPKRSPVSDFLLAGGQSQSWLVGNKVITVTTSGGSNKLQRSGICEKCSCLIQQHVENTSTASQEKVEPETDIGKKKVGDEKLIQETKEQSTPPSTGSLRQKRQRSKSGNTHRVDSSGNVIQQKAVRTEDQEEVKHLTLFSSVVSEDVAKVTASSRGSSAESLKGAEVGGSGKHGKIGEGGDTTRGATKVSFMDGSDKGHGSKVDQKAAGGNISGTGMRMTTISPTPGASSTGGEESTAIYQPRFSSRVSSASIYQCNCWCQGWAEIHVRRPTGNTSWIMRIQNGGALLPSTQDFPVADISTLLLRNRDLDTEIDMILPDDTSSEDSSTEVSSSSDDEVEDDERVCIGNGQGSSGADILDFSTPSLHDDDLFADIICLPSDVEHLTFPRPEMGLSPIGPSFLQEYMAMKKRDPGEIRVSQYSLVLKEFDSDHESISQLALNSKPPLNRSNSSPALIPTSKAQTTSTVTAMSPRNVARSFLEDSARKPGSYKDPSFLEKQYNQHNVPTIRVGEGAVSGSSGDQKDSENSQESSPDVLSSGSSEFIDISYETDVQDAERTEAKVAAVTAQDGVAPSKPAPRPKEDGTKLEKPQTLAVEPVNQEKSNPQKGQDLLHPQQRRRGHTVSYMFHMRDRRKGQQLEQRVRRPSDSKHRGSFTQRDSYRSGLNPSFVFLQVYFSPLFSDGADRPLAIPLSQVGQRALKVLDRIPPHDTHKIGVVYVGDGQTNDETAILSNVYGSARYMNFLRGLGKLVSLKDVDPEEVYTGGLDKSGSDGHFTYWWQDDIMQVIFHIATLMPNKESDPTCNGKKLHIGNDFVSIVYNESGQPYRIDTIKGQFNFAEIIVEPLDNESNLVSIQAKPELEEMLGRRGPWMVSDQRVALLVRQMALHANLASQIHRSRPAEAYCSNWLERLRQIHRIRDKVAHMGASSNPMLNVMSARHLQTPERKMSGRQPSMSKINDFSDYA